MYSSGVIQTPRHKSMNVPSPEPYKKANIFLDLIEYELKSLLSS